ncbi:MAG: thiamine pyrophosphate-dependent enzyme [Alphaproteobacteria bacterium]|nr:thiamine pyrophosphate-dependent enzyme [Alphaproteobacteria bacterium]
MVEAVRRVFPPEALVAIDTGAHRILASQLWEAYEPRTVLQSTGLCTMGCALPLAIGARLAAPERPAVVLTGDGGLLMVLGELATLAELRIPLTIVVFVDASLALIEMKQRSRQLPNHGVDFARCDFGAIGRAMGGAGETVSDRAGLERVLEAGLARRDGFTLIGAVIDRKAYDGRI